MLIELSMAGLCVLLLYCHVLLSRVLVQWLPRGMKGTATQYDGLVPNGSLDVSHFSISYVVNRLDNRGYYDTADLLRATRWSILFLSARELRAMTGDEFDRFFVNVVQKVERGPSGSRSIMVVTDEQNEVLTRRVRKVTALSTLIEVIVALDSGNELRERVAPHAAFAIVGDSRGRVIYGGLARQTDNLLLSRNVNPGQLPSDGTGWLSLRGTDDSGLVAVRSDVVCTITRMRFRSVFGAVWARWSFARLSRIVRDQPNPITSSFCFEDLRTCIILSVWTSHSEVGRFNALVEDHVHVARMTFPLLSRMENGEVEAFTGLFKLRNVSHSNLIWPALGDLGEFITPV